MPNKNYIQGVRKERKIVNEARDKDLIAFRSAGSHSPIDVVIINKEKHLVRFIQCKPDTMSKACKDRLEQEHLELNGVYLSTFEVI